MPDDDGNETNSEAPPWPQRLYDSVWLIAGTAILFWMLSYVIWGLVDILTIPGGVDMRSPIQSPEGHWWNHPVAGTEKAWLGARLFPAVILFGWMVGWSHLDEQNPTGRTYRVDADTCEQKVSEYVDRAKETA